MKILPQASIYLPLWLNSEAYNDIGKRLDLSQIDRFLLAFAVPDRSEKWIVPSIDPALISLINSLAGRSEMALSFGGWGDSQAQHDQIIKSFRLAGDKPLEFTKNVKALISEVESIIGRRINTVDLDWEHPVADDKLATSSFIKACRQNLDVKLSIAIPAEYGLDGYDFSNQGIVNDLDYLNIMAYDAVGPWSTVTGHHAPGIWTIDRAKWWADHLPAEKVHMGFPTYGYNFGGTHEAGAKFDPKDVTTLYYRAIPKQYVHDNTKNLTSEANLPSGWVHV